MQVRETPYYPRGPQHPPPPDDSCSVDPHAPFDPSSDQRREKPQLYSGVTPRSRSASRQSSAKSTPVRGGAQGRGPPYDASALSPHESDDDLVLICVDCGSEILDAVAGEVCPVTGKLHR